MNFIPRELSNFMLEDSRNKTCLLKKLHNIGDINFKERVTEQIILNFNNFDISKKKRLLISINKLFAKFKNEEGEFDLSISLKNKNTNVESVPQIFYLGNYEKKIFSNFSPIGVEIEIDKPCEIVIKIISNNILSATFNGSIFIF